jgi:hypothetical protein
METFFGKIKEMNAGKYSVIKRPLFEWIRQQFLQKPVI